MPILHLGFLEHIPPRGARLETRTPEKLGWRGFVKVFSAIEYLHRLGVFGDSANTGSIVTRAELLITLACGFPSHPKRKFSAGLPL